MVFTGRNNSRSLGGDRYETKLLVILHGIRVLCIHKEPDPARRAVNLHEFSHSAQQQHFAQTFALMFKLNRQAAQPNSAHLTRKTRCFGRRQCLALDLTQI